MELFYNPGKALDISMESLIGIAKTGTLELPEMGTPFVQEMILDTRPRKFGELLTLSGLSHGKGVWIGNAQDLIKRGICSIKTVIGCRDDIMNYLILKGHDEAEAFDIMENVRRGKGLKLEWVESMKAHDVPQWYIDSCEKIEYMFPRAHAAAYVLDAVRLGYYKVHHPVAFYTAVFSARFNDQNGADAQLSTKEMRELMTHLNAEIKRKKWLTDGETTQKLEDRVDMLQLLLEAKERGVTFEPVRLYGSHAKLYQMEPKTKSLIAPFSSIPGIGEIAANTLYEEGKKAPFTSIEELKSRGGANKTCVEALSANGSLDGLVAKKHKFF
jgi:DNA polymerase-3 subunit alpha (Gram-positive type)